MKDNSVSYYPASDSALSEKSVAAMPSTEPARHGNRLDALDGIRTIAVFLVIAFHISMPRMSAGYIGVDIFFVLSGFLITRGLVRDIQKRGKLRLARFWSRRMKRLMPAALLTILAVLAWGNWLIPIYRHSDIGQDAFYTVFYLANWHFVDSTSYFAADGNISPLMHMWLLAVEEQFYLVWPLLITLVLVILRRLFRKHELPTSRVLLILGGIAIGVVFLSAVLLYFESLRSINLAYMATHTKAFEPMLGAFCAIAMSNEKWEKFCVRYARLLIWGGGLLMVALFAILDGPAPLYFAGGALLFSCAAATFILGITYGLQSPEAKILAWAPISYLGRISYGLYLWHWLWAVWLLNPQLGFQPLRAFLVVILTIGTASLSYHLLEMPVRSGWIGRRISIPLSLGSGLAAMVVVSLVAATLGGTPISKWMNFGADKAALNQKMLLVVGDSVPKRLIPALVPWAESRGLEVASAARGGCSPLAIYQYEGEVDHAGKRCLEIADTQVEAIDKYHPGYVLWWSRYEGVPRFDAAGKLLTPDKEEFWEAQKADLEKAIARLTKDGATLVFVLTERPGKGILERNKADFRTVIIDTLLNHDEYRQRFNDLLRAVARENSLVKVMEGEELFCPQSATVPQLATKERASGAKKDDGGLCDDFVPGNGYIRPDGSHINNDLFGKEISNRLLDAFDRLVMNEDKRK